MSHPSCHHTGYSLSCAEYDDLLAIAQGCCMLCRKPETRFRVDHDHALGFWAVRGIVCNGCNQRVKHVDSGQKTATAAIACYFANAWHLHQPSSAAKRARARPRVECVLCGHNVAARSDGSPWPHWSRLTTRPAHMCPSAEGGSS